jgi:hypothetical protein
MQFTMSWHGDRLWIFCALADLAKMDCLGV